MSNEVDSTHDFDQLGGVEGIKPIIQSFIDKVYGDMIIGFLFINVDKEQLIAREVEFASRHLGGSVSYTGKPIGPVHRKHPINKGHFHRRLWLLGNTLDEHGVNPDIKERWLSHNRQLEPVITDGTDCVAPQPTAP